MCKTKDTDCLFVNLQNNMRKDWDDMFMEMEDKYQEAKRLFLALSCMKACEDKIIICEELIEKFERLGDYKDSEAIVKKCCTIIKQIKEQQQEYSYKLAKRHMEEATCVQDYERADFELHQLGSYKDTKVQSAECNKRKRAVEKRLFLRAKIITLISAVIITVVVLLQFPIGKYYAGNVCMKLHIYKMAASTYQKIDDYKDSHPRYRECEYQYGLRLKKKGKYAKALKCFQQSVSRKDSNELAVEMQKKVLKEVKVGKKIKIGDSSWIILWKEENQVLLMKKSFIKGQAFDVETGTTQWEKSGVRAWLNSEYLKEHFNAEEVGNMVDYHSQTKESYPYQDKLVVPSQEEAAFYQEFLKKGEMDQWLRTAAITAGQVMFLNTKAEVMTEGYSPKSSQFAVRPMFWYSLEE